MDPYLKLKDWLAELHEQFGDKVPQPDQIESVINAVEKATNAKLTKYLGQGDNGIAFLADDGDVIKYTIDNKEVLLWSRLLGKKQQGIIAVAKTIHLVDKVKGGSYLYVIKADYAPYNVTAEQTKLIRRAFESAIKRSEQSLSQSRQSSDPYAHSKNRTQILMDEFEQLAEIDSSFENIPWMLADLADKHGGYIYDLRPDNFRLDSNKKVILIDPSVPDLRGEGTRPAEILYEERLDIALWFVDIEY